MQGPVAIILAAGHGKRMRSETAKVLHEVCGRPMIRYVVEAVRGAGARTIVVVVGYGADQVRAALADEPDIRFTTQERQLGTGDAVRACQPLLRDYRGPALVLVGDEPLVRPEPLADLLARREVEGAACLLGTAIVPDPSGFGRILRDGAGRFLRIVEERDCSPEERAIREVNPSCYAFELPGLWDALERLDTGNAQGEYYLTDAPLLLQSMGRRVIALPCLEPDDILGVNTRQHLAQANAILQSRIQDRLMEEGVSIVDPRNTYIDGRARIGRDTIVYPFSVITGRVEVGVGCKVGPFAHLREGTILEDGVEVGAFVEVNRSRLESGAKARHLAYLGDARVGRSVNVGAGVITANYDGRSKQETIIGRDAFLGSGSILVAPVAIGEGAIVGAGAVVTRNHDVEPGQTVVGVPRGPSPIDRLEAADPVRFLRDFGQLATDSIPRILPTMSDQEEAIKKLGRMIQDIQFAMLTTVEPDGSLRSRPMATHQNSSGDFDGILWFFTKADAPKVDEVEQDRHVNLSYASPGQSKYVSVSGMARLVRDGRKIKELWDPKYQAWFPKGLDDPEVALLRVDVTKAEYWDTPGSTVAHAIGLVKAIATGQSYKPGDHEKVTL